MEEVKFRVRESKRFLWIGVASILLFILVSVLPNVEYLMEGDWQGFIENYELPVRMAVLAAVGVFMIVTNFTHGLKVYHDHSMEYTGYFGKKTRFTVYDIERSEITSTGGTKGLVIYGTDDKVLAKLEYNMEGYETFCEWLETAQKQDLEGGLSREEQLIVKTGVNMEVETSAKVLSKKGIKRLKIAMVLAPWIMLLAMILGNLFGSKMLRARMVLAYPVILIVIYLIFHKNMIIGYPKGISMREMKEWKKSKVRFPIFSAIMFSMFAFYESRTVISFGDKSYAPMIIAVAIYIVYLFRVKKDGFTHRFAVGSILLLYIILAEPLFHVAFSTPGGRWVEECQISAYINTDPEATSYAKGTLLRDNGENYVIHEFFEPEYEYYKDHADVRLYCYKSIFGYSCGDYKYHHKGWIMME